MIYQRVHCNLGEAYVILVLKGCLHKRLRHVKVEKQQTFFVCNSSYNFTSAETGEGEVV